MLAKSSTRFQSEGLPSRVSCPQDVPCLSFPPHVQFYLPSNGYGAAEEEAGALPAAQKPPVMDLVAKCNSVHLDHDHPDYFIDRVHSDVSGTDRLHLVD